MKRLRTVVVERQGEEIATNGKAANQHEETIVTDTNTVSVSHPPLGKWSYLPEVLWAMIYSYFNGLRDRSILSRTCRDLERYRRHPLAVSHLEYTHFSCIVERRDWLADLKRIAAPVGSLQCTGVGIERFIPDLVATFPEIKSMDTYSSLSDTFVYPLGLKRLHLCLCTNRSPAIDTVTKNLYNVLHALVELSGPISFDELLFLPPTLIRCNLSITTYGTIDTDSSFRGWCHFFGLPALHSVSLKPQSDRSYFGWSRLERDRLLLAPGLPICQWRELKLFAARSHVAYTTSNVAVATTTTTSSPPPLPFLHTFVVRSRVCYTEDDWDHWVKIAPHVSDLTLDSYGLHVSDDMSIRPLHRWTLQRLSLMNMAKTYLYSLTQPSTLYTSTDTIISSVSSLPTTITTTTSATSTTTTAALSPAHISTSSTVTLPSLFRGLSSLQVCWAPYKEPGLQSIWYRVVSELSSSPLTSLHLEYTQGHTGSYAFSSFSSSPTEESAAALPPPSDGRHCEDIFVSVTRYLPQLRSFKWRSRRIPTAPHVVEGLSSLYRLHTLRLFYDEIDSSGTFYDRLASSLPPLVRHLATFIWSDTGPDSTRVVEGLVLCASRQLLVWEINAAEWVKQDIFEWMRERLTYTPCSLGLLDKNAEL